MPRYSLRTLLPGQFGVLSLFVLITAAAVAFAVARLPIPLAAKLGPVVAIAICFVGWALARGYRYPAPQQPASVETRRFWRMVICIVLALFWIALAVWTHAKWEIYGGSLREYYLGMAMAFLGLVSAVLTVINHR